MPGTALVKVCRKCRRREPPTREHFAANPRASCGLTDLCRDCLAGKRKPGPKPGIRRPPAPPVAPAVAPRAEPDGAAFRAGVEERIAQIRAAKGLGPREDYLARPGGVRVWREIPL